MVRSGVVCGACRCWWLRDDPRGDEATTRWSRKPSCWSNIGGLEKDEGRYLPGVEIYIPMYIYFRSKELLLRYQVEFAIKAIANGGGEQRQRPLVK